jgi:hypothetical protein
MYPLTSKLRAIAGPVLALGAFCCGTAHASILWDGDASKGTGVFSSLNIENNPGQINVVTDSTYGKVFQFICFDNGNTKVRTEGSHMAGFQPVAGGTYYFGWRHKWGPLPTLCGKWQVLEQIHLNGSSGPVPFGLHVDGCDTNMHWQYNDPSGTSHDFLVQPFPLNSWHSFVYHEKWSESESDGFVEVWYDGTMKTLTNGSTRYPAAWCFPGELSYWKWGVYRSGSGGPIGTSYAYLWRPRAGTTFSDVDPLGGTTTFTITASAGTNGTISPSGGVTVTQGANKTFTITANSGYAISGVTVDGASVGAVTSYTFSNVQANHTISASFAAVARFTITASAGSNGTISPSGAVAVNQGASQSFTITPNSGYLVSGVTVDGASVGAVTSYTFTNVQANHTISASFAVNNSTTITASTGFYNQAITPQVGQFTAQFDASASLSPINATMSLSQGAVTGYSGMATIVRFNPTGDIDARNGGAYTADATIPYSANTTYHFRMVIDVSAHTYSIYVTPPGGSELTVGANYAFRTEQAGVTQLDNWNADVAATPGGSIVMSNFTVAGAPPPVAAPTFSPGGGSYSSAQNVTISSATGGASIRYTTDGSTPTSTAGTLYSGPVNVSASTTLKAIAYESGMTDSTVSSATYTITSNFTITASAGANGTISPSGAVTVASGASQSFTITPNSGYHVSSVTVDGASVGAVTSYTFTNVQANHTIAASFAVNTSTTITAAMGFYNQAITPQSGQFTAQFDASASLSPINATMSLSQGAISAYTGMAVVVRFNPSGDIDARNGGAYAAASTIPYAANTTYHFRMVIDVSAHTYSIYVTPPGGSELTVGTNYAFRTEQAGVTQLDNWNADVNATPGGSITVSNFTTN